MSRCSKTELAARQYQQLVAAERTATPVASRAGAVAALPAQRASEKTR